MKQQRGRKKTDDEGLTPQQRKFISLYTDPLKDSFFNATRAVLLSYNVTNRNTAAVIGSENLRKLNIQQAIAARVDTDEINDLIVNGIIERLNDPHGKHWMETVYFIAKVRGDFKPRIESAVSYLTPEAREDEYQAMIKLLNV